MKKNIILFILTFLVLFLIYEFMILNDKRKRKSKNFKGKSLIEVKLLEYCFKVPVNKIKYNKLLQVIAFVSSIDIALIVTISCGITEVGLFQILIAMVILLPILLCSYYIVSNIYIRSLKRRNI